MIWNYIRDFIVQYITGGITSNQDLITVSIGGGFENDTLYYQVGTDGNEPVLLSLSDWLATTLTIICMCAIVFFAYWLVRWVFKAVSSAFLLRR